MAVQSHNLTLADLAAIAERHHLRVTIRGDGSVFGIREDLEKLRALLDLKERIRK